MIYCGDCLEIMGGLRAGSIIADPPYGIDYQSARRTDKSRWKPKIRNDKSPFVDWLPLAYKITDDGGCLLCFCRWDVEEVFRRAIEGAGYVVRSQVIWDRVIHGMGDLSSSFAPQHDVIWFATKGRYAFPGKRPKSVIRVPRISPRDLVHPNEKPVALMMSLVSSVARGVVLDPMMGSGATGVACARLGVPFIGIEIDSGYFEIARKNIGTIQPVLL